MALVLGRLEPRRQVRQMLLDLGQCELGGRVSVLVPCRSSGVTGRATYPSLEPLLPCWQPSWGYLLWVLQTCSRAPGCDLLQVEPPRRGPAVPPARLPTAQEVCYRRAQQMQRESASWLQAAPRPAEKPSSIHIAAPGEKRRIAHVPNPRLATGESPPQPWPLLVGGRGRRGLGMFLVGYKKKQSAKVNELATLYHLATLGTVVGPSVSLSVNCG